MNIRNILILSLTFALILSPLALAGHHYHGHGYMMPSWDMTDLDTDQDGALSFDEFGASHMDKLRAGFNMIDADKDGVIGASEWNDFLRVHGMDKN